MLHSMGFVILGLAAGMLSGLIGIGGGVIIVPALFFIFGLTLHQAQGTTLAMMVPPVGLLAAWQYYRHGFVNLHAAGLICAGFVVGAFLGADLAIWLPNAALQKLFGVAMILVGLKMLFAHAS